MRGPAAAGRSRSRSGREPRPGVRILAATLLVALPVPSPAESARPEAAGRRRVTTFDFATSDHGWTGGFADYPAGSEDFFELVADRRPLPPYVRGGAPALHLRGNNHSDDLFLFAKGPVEGFAPGATYRVRIDVVIASDAPRGAVGIGGAPGEGVTVKAGATTAEPRTADAGGTVEIDVDKGNQVAGGRDARALGHVGVRTSVTAPRYRLKRLRWGRRPPVEVPADPGGRIWALVGADSGFEGTTALYVVRVRVRTVRVT